MDKKGIGSLLEDKSPLGLGGLADAQLKGKGLLSQYYSDNEKMRDSFEKEFVQLSNKLAKLERHFEDSWTDRNKRIENQISAIAHQVSKMDGDTNAAISALYDDIDNAKSISMEKINYLSESVSQADEIVGHLAKTAVAGGYSVAAGKEGQAADKMRQYAVSFFVLAGFPVAYLVFESGGGAIDWPHIASKVFLSIFMLAPATYLVRESSRHREQEITNRKKGMDLATIDPFLKSLPESKSYN
ncbi:hypothetical protein [Methylomonas methanica]|uniref:Uncharacterized protein n=1 Tax=Methylomonas methanica TaxID=421 RepID=A0A177LVJ3_METMH|nr:hypothetical protein [Methylomonas methanica]OAH97485.1 hypothetical protein A1332_21445 [Methylomonas methanica]